MTWIQSLIQSLTWEHPHAVGAAITTKKNLISLFLSSESILFFLLTSVNSSLKLKGVLYCCTNMISFIAQFDYVYVHI